MTALSCYRTGFKFETCTLEDLIWILGLHADEVNKCLDVLEADKKN